MLMFQIKISTGDADKVRVYHFSHKQCDTVSIEQQKDDFDTAVKEINHIYKDYGRFATSVGVLRLFDKFGFERTVP